MTTSNNNDIYSNIYIGIVLQNNDPERMGSVKVFIPGITDVVYDGWKNATEDKVFKFIDGDLLSILDELLEELPWSRQAHGVFGGELQFLNRGNGKLRESTRISDKFIDSPPSDSFGLETYTPGDYSGTAPGIYSVPSVGSKVFVFFLNGDRRIPVYFSSFHSATDWNNIYKDGKDYPNGYENDQSDDNYESKHVLNTEKHTLEFIDTDGKEEIKLSHFSGSNLSINNSYTSEYAVGDKMELIDNNKYSTIKNNVYGRVTGDAFREVSGYDVETVHKDKFSTVDGDETKTIYKNNYETIGADRGITVAKSDILQVFGSKYDDIKGQYALDIGQEYVIYCQSNFSSHIIGGENIMVEKDYNLSVNGMMKYMISGEIDINSTENINILTPKDVSIKAIGKLSLDGMYEASIAGAKGLSLNSGLDTSIVTTKNTKIESGGAIDLMNILGHIKISPTGMITIGNTAGSITITPAGTISIKGTMVDVMGGYVNVKGGIVSIN